MTLEGAPEWSSIAVGDHWIRTYQAGPHQASEAVVFIHGNPGSAADFTGLIDAVAPPRRAIAFDLPDFGQSIAAPGFGHTKDEYSHFVGDAFKALGIRRAHLVLHDLGGPIGLDWASTHTGQIASVTLINTGVLAGYKWHRTARVWQTPVAGELLQAAAFRSMFRRIITRAEPHGLPRDFVDGMYDNYDRRTRRAVLDIYRDLKKVGKTSKQLIPLLAAADLPCLVVWGAGDPYLPASFADRQRSAFPRAQVHILPASGHWPFIDDPPAVTELLTAFLATVE
ncbi:MAG TPA: alpha/beta fold hydrolase [Solirubrobacterales bacterium]|nr:alpha/beta fold hydrolase [Solirubrobacterales bacterium]HNF83998.1 alpha/beta fold hydrolase [Solirubrobacterales bacterium]